MAVTSFSSKVFLVGTTSSTVGGTISTSGSTGNVSAYIRFSSEEFNVRVGKEAETYGTEVYGSRIVIF